MWTGEDRRLKALIHTSFTQSRRNYGSPRVYDDLREWQERVSRKRIVRLMQEEGLVARVRKRYKHTTLSDHEQTATTFDGGSDQSGCLRKTASTDGSSSVAKPSTESGQALSAIHVQSGRQSESRAGVDDNLVLFLNQSIAHYRATRTSVTRWCGPVSRTGGHLRRSLASRREDPADVLL